MNEQPNINNCERAGELVAYFYGEATRNERHSFDAHLAACDLCREELDAFAGVREAVGHWRAEIFKHAPAVSFADTVALTQPEQPQREVIAVVPPRSALAALREFFTLSPVWLRAGMVVTTLAVCALAALAVVNAEVRWDNKGIAFNTRLRSETQTAPPVLAVPAGKVYSQAELDNIASERDAARRELEDTRAQLDDSRAANLIAAVETLEPASATVPTPNNARREPRTAPVTPNSRPRRFRDDRDEEDVPRLYDLLLEAN